MSIDFDNDFSDVDLEDDEEEDIVIIDEDNDEDEDEKLEEEGDIDNIDEDEFENSEDADENKEDDEDEDDIDIIDDDIDSESKKTDKKNTNITVPFITKYEYTKILSIRSQQIANGSPIYIDKTRVKNMKPMNIAELELKENKLNKILIKRKLPNGIIEERKLSDLKFLDFY